MVKSEPAPRRTTPRLSLALALPLALGLALSARAETAPPPGPKPLRQIEILPDRDRPKPVAGEMLIVTLRGIYDRPVAREDLQLAPDLAFDWLPLARDDWQRRPIDGLEHLVMERRLAVFPKAAGVLRFGPAEQRLTIIERDGRQHDQILRAAPTDIAVAPFPQAGGWPMAAKALELDDQLSAPSDALDDGAVLTRTVTLRGLGLLPEMLPPRPIVSETWLITFAAPVERQLELTPEGPLATVIWRWSFRPETGEPGVLEPVDIPFFNTTTRRMDKVTLPALPIGYASFHQNRLETGRIGTADRLAMALAGLAGLALGLALWGWPVSHPPGAPGGGLAPGRGLALGLRRLSPGPIWALWRAWARVKRGPQDLPPAHQSAAQQAKRAADLARLRRRAQAYLDWRAGRQGALGSSRQQQALAALEAALYQPVLPGKSSDLSGFFRAITKG